MCFIDLGYLRFELGILYKPLWVVDVRTAYGVFTFVTRQINKRVNKALMVGMTFFFRRLSFRENNLQLKASIKLPNYLQNIRFIP